MNADEYDRLHFVLASQASTKSHLSCSGRVMTGSADVLLQRVSRSLSGSAEKPHMAKADVKGKGIKHDENGNPRTFNKNDWLEFTKGATCLEELYSNSSIPGTDFKVNGFRTLSENIADVEGLKQSFMAYKNYQKEKGYRKEGRLYRMEDIAADQLFFLGHAFTFCEKFKKNMGVSILMDIHAPSVLRVNNVVSNIEEFADTFRCSPGSPMNPENRCSIY
ncbi:hypothetical protein RB195_016595 [Necator americanus]|uniref:Peptidase M13 C-terminal domain-containing protein n=1 Tax=Necator americanus TaxID=51031 RepID=A0ABR1C3J2_NECAM